MQKFFCRVSSLRKGWMESRHYSLQYQKETAFILAAVNVDIVEVDVALLSFMGYALPKMLSQNSLPGPYFPGYYDTLRHFPGRLNRVPKVLV